LDGSKYPKKDTFGEMSDGIPSLANLAMGNKNKKCALTQIPAAAADNLSHGRHRYLVREGWKFRP